MFADSQAAFLAQNDLSRTEQGKPTLRPVLFSNAVLPYSFQRSQASVHDCMA